MKAVVSFLTLITFSFFLVACTSDQENFDTSEQASFKQVAPNNQDPNNKYDESMFGLYHGIVASGSTLSRGKIWVSIGNDANFTATIEIVGGQIYQFALKPQLTTYLENQIFEFENNIGSFILDLTDFNNPHISDIQLNGNSYFGRLVKSRSYSPASVVTAIFVETGNPTFSGTWSLIADGTNPNPNGNGGDGITSVLITYNSNMYEDTILDPFNASQCLGNPTYFPTINSFGTPEFTICDYQTTEFELGMAKWNLGYDPSTLSYYNYISCETVPYGTFSWTSSDNTTMRLGHIILD